MHVPVGVLQGTRVGPLLFVVMINDLQLLSDQSFHIWKFADDTTVSDIVPPSCPSSLQQDFNFIHRQRQSIRFILAALGLAPVAGINTLNTLIPDNLRHHRIRKTKKPLWASKTAAGNVSPEPTRCHKPSGFKGFPCYKALYNNPSYSRILIGSHL